jgi:hypothetical protein
MRPIDADALLREVDDLWRKADENERFREAEVLGWLYQMIQSADTVEDVEMLVFDQEEIYHNCTVQVLKNTVTGEESVGWWKEGEEP